MLLLTLLVLFCRLHRSWCWMRQQPMWMWRQMHSSRCVTIELCACEQTSKTSSSCGRLRPVCRHRCSSCGTLCVYRVCHSCLQSCCWDRWLVGLSSQRSVTRMLTVAVPLLYVHACLACLPVQETLRAEFSDRTLLAVAHRLHTIIEADRWGWCVQASKLPGFACAGVSMCWALHVPRSPCAFWVACCGASSAMLQVLILGNLV
jgi:hypothetical protein